MKNRFTKPTMTSKNVWDDILGLSEQQPLGPKLETPAAIIRDWFELKDDQASYDEVRAFTHSHLAYLTEFVRHSDQWRNVYSPQITRSLIEQTNEFLELLARLENYRSTDKGKSRYM